MAVSFAESLLNSIAEELVQEGLVTRDQLTVARVSQHDLGEDLGRILVKKGFVTEDQFLSFVGKRLAIPHVSLKDATVPDELIQRVPAHLVRRYHAVPLREEGDEVVVAMSNPLDRAALDDLKGALRAKIKPALAVTAEIDRLIDQSYGAQKLDKGWGIEPIEVTTFSSESALEGGPEAGGGRLEKIATGPRIVETVTRMIVQAHQEKASDIHIEPAGDGVHIRYRVDGLLEERPKLPREMQLPVVSRIKIMAGLNIAERRLPQDGRVRVRIGAINLDLRVSTCPTLYGEKVVLRLLSKESVIGIESLGFSDRDRKVFAELVSRSHGLFLVSGPTGSGKSTTLYSALSRINSIEKNIVSIEDPVESEIPGVNQAQINLKAGVTFASYLRSILRQDPDVIMVGEIRDSETAEIAVRAAVTGHLVLSTLHTNTAAGAIPRLIDLGVPPFLVASALIGVLAQRLVRKICPQCSKKVEPDSTQLGSLFPQVKQCFQGKGCRACRMTGYLGRIGVFELAPMGETVRRMIGPKVTDQMVEEELRRLGVWSILEDGLDKVNQGITTIDEVLRVSKGD